MQTRHIIIAGVLFITGIAVGVLLSRNIPPASPITAQATTAVASSQSAVTRPNLGPAPASMQFIEYRDSNGNQRRVWRGGNHFLRLERNLAGDGSPQLIIISNSPDTWYWDAATNRARHLVDKGPTYNVILPAFQRINSSTIRSLQIGQERAFFDRQENVARSEAMFNDMPVESRTLEVDDHVLTLLTRKDTGTPVQMRLEQPEGATLIDYLQYDATQKFDISHFSLPASVIVEGAETEG